jgi:glutamate-ammonia-ligase adenylyltransferase
MTRARFVLGSESLKQRFEKVREQVITAPRDRALLRQEVSTMRQRVSMAHPIKAGQFDVKHSPGGMVDAEFAIQTMVLSYAAEHPRLIDNVGNIALCQRAEQCGLLSAGVGEAAADAYRELRKIQHKARLDEVPTQVDPSFTLAQSQAIRALWTELMEKP